MQGAGPKVLADAAELDLAQPRWRLHPASIHPRCAHAAAALPPGVASLTANFVPQLSQSSDVSSAQILHGSVGSFLSDNEETAETRLCLCAGLGPAGMLVWGGFDGEHCCGDLIVIASGASGPTQFDGLASTCSCCSLLCSRLVHAQAACVDLKPRQLPAGF